MDQENISRPCHGNRSTFNNLTGVFTIKETIGVYDIIFGIHLIRNAIIILVKNHTSIPANINGVLLTGPVKTSCIFFSPVWFEGIGIVYIGIQTVQGIGFDIRSRKIPACGAGKPANIE